MDAYIEKLSRFADDEYGRQFRRQFEDNRGSSELAMLQSPSGDELAQIRKAVAIMTRAEKGGACDLTDEQIHRIADDAGIDRGLFAIFVNGYALECRKSPSE
ncbi:MAG: hypothetical protein J7M40_20275 [Planctomycetes bacterium]|nr:hypothetical protein [Planctomycetota bacterium]